MAAKGDRRSIAERGVAALARGDLSLRDWIGRQGSNNPVVNAARGTVRGARERARRGRRMPPSLNYQRSSRRPETVYYLAPDYPAPSGGIRNLYRHVDVLNATGIRASVLHHRAGFRCDWFVNDTAVTSASEAVIGPRDVLVVPEWYTPGFSALPQAVRKIVFNQSARRIFEEIPSSDSGPRLPYRTLENLTGVMVVSESDEAWLRFCLPELVTARVRLAIDPTLFFPPPEPAGRRIAYLPSRRAYERHALFHALNARGSLAGWELVPIEGLAEPDVGAAMRTCSIFLSFSELEGFGLPPVEAMASGCYVVGFSGFGGNEYFWPDVSSLVPEGDLLTFAQAVEEAVCRHEKDPGEVHECGLTASKRVADRYNLPGLTNDLTTFFGRVLG